jgi:glyceraldehyde 3-phosphate dehydrogenase
MMKVIDELWYRTSIYYYHTFVQARPKCKSIPTTTGAAKVHKNIPTLDGKIGGCGIRVPVPDGSLTDITFNVKRAVTINEINEAFRYAVSK